MEQNKIIELMQSSSNSVEITDNEPQPSTSKAHNMEERAEIVRLLTKIQIQNLNEENEWEDYNDENCPPTRAATPISEHDFGDPPTP